MSLARKTSLAALIPLLLIGALFIVSPAHAAPAKAAAVVANVLPGGGNDNFTGNGPFIAYPYQTNETLSYPSYKPGYQFWVYIDVINVTGLYTYQVGFTFNSSVLQVNNVTGPGQYTEVNRKKIFPSYNWFLSSASAVTGNATAALIKMNANVTGKVTAEGYYCTDPTTAENGSGLLMQVCMCINPALSYSVTSARMMNFSLTEKDIQLILVWTDGKTQLQPPQSGVHSGYFTLSGPVPEFPSTFSSVLLATVLILATFAAALFTVTKGSRKRKELNHDRSA